MWDEREKWSFTRIKTIEKRHESSERTCISKKKRKKKKVKSEKLIIQRWKWNYISLNSFLMLCAAVCGKYFSLIILSCLCITTENSFFYSTAFICQIRNKKKIHTAEREWVKKKVIANDSNSSVRYGGRFCGFYHIHIIVMFHTHKLLITHIYEAWIHKLMINYITERMQTNDFFCACAFFIF